MSPLYREEGDDAPTLDEEPTIYAATRTAPAAEPLDVRLTNESFLSSDLYDHLAAMHVIAHGHTCNLCKARLASEATEG